MFYCEVLSGIWIGDTDILNSTDFIQDNNITVILNCTQLFDFPDITSIEKIRLPFSPVNNSESDLQLLRQNKDKIINYIDQKIDNHNILICCYDGKSISPFIVALYIAEKSNIDKASIYNILLTKNSELSLWCDLALFYP
tara:strand:+ start:1313 stop:1732 length:420 start_codon:yes stop_codon:yes gene_type:complete